MVNEAVEAEKGHALLSPREGGETRRPRRDFFGAIVFVAIAAFFVVQSLRMPFRDAAWQWYTAPNIFPLAMSACLGAAALFVAVRGFLGWRAQKDAIGPIHWAASARQWALGRFIAGAAMIAALISLLGRIDFYLLAPASILVIGVAFRSDPLPKASKSSLIAAVFVVALLYVISKVFGIVFP
jgi:hypothetical protein